MKDSELRELTGSLSSSSDSKRSKLFRLHDELTTKAKKLMLAKNIDYAREEDPYKNFRNHGLLGILIRMGDKLARLENYLQNGTLAVADESVEDSLLDLINYAVLFGGLKLDEQELRRAEALLEAASRTESSNSI